MVAGECVDDDHRAGTDWTTEGNRLCGRGLGDYGYVRLRVISQQQSALRKQSRSTAVGQESEKANADEAAGQNVEEEASQELLRGKRHRSLLATVGIILPVESDLIIVEGHEAVIGDGHAMGVAGEVTDDMLGSAERGFGIDHPVLAKQRP